MMFLSEPNLPLAQQNKIGVLLLNLGTPQSYDVKAVRSYLREFLSDYRVVELAPCLWQPLLRGVILPFRSKKSAHSYQTIWQDEGSPLAWFTQRQAEGLRQRLPEHIVVTYAMTYGKPSVAETLQQMKQQGVGCLLVLPLYPQYASSSTGAALDKVWKQLLQQRNQMSVRTVSRFYDDEAYINALVKQIRSHRAEHGAGEKLMFSFHGIPQRHADLGDRYPQECRVTAQQVAQQLGLQEHEYIVSFQSRFGRNKWLEPSTQTLFSELPKKHHVHKLDVVCAGFVSDCLETLEEIAIIGREQFLQAGGEQFHYIPCLNDNDDWLDALVRLVNQNIMGWKTE